MRTGDPIGFGCGERFRADGKWTRPGSTTRLHEPPGGELRPHGGNDDGNWNNPIKAGELRTLAELEGPAVISHIWITIAQVETWHLKTIVVRIYWDGESSPSVEAARRGIFSASVSVSTFSTNRTFFRSDHKKR